ncbi:MAG: hypothetical protein COT24_02790 [Candidatus Kerfeldbacteria bacterium CG08_land_8_20_14_0_20_40_16]|uniref:NAD-dependent epimerase/dehydratase domain-containing protein n=1 Tax=Candidatus Kerfeldbacteria bacterium CG08_land_8_20_14_0_20_40_16 TaxID=2014244 RepID=A0A2H0YVQ7_9BACT|nr:MAG: hypothetical protein COT24_02790 [Candidatus Kerfeldbacteria bacterium CG08_land_8_20_14_0_20_40_16]
MKILISGGTSSLGRALKPVLSDFSEVITAGRKDCDITLDLTDPIDKTSLPPNVDVIVHTAANFGGKSDEEILATENINVLGTLKLCQAAARTKTKHFVLISTMFSCLKENSPFYNVYALSKKQAEEIARYYLSTSSIALAVLRPSQIYGNEDRFKEHQPFFYSIIDQVEKDKDIMFYGSHDARRNFIHIDDLTTIISKVVQKKTEGTYSCQHPTDVTYSEIAKAAITAYQSKSSIRFLKDKPDIPDNIFDKDDSLYKKINFYPQITIGEGMRKIALYRKVRP